MVPQVAAVRQLRHAYEVDDKYLVMDRSRATDSELLAAALRDGEAFAEFYRRYEEPILVFMLRRAGGCSDVAADLTAEVFAAALHGLKRYRADTAVPAAWLFGIARNVLAASRRKSRVVESARRKLGFPRLELTDEMLEHLDRLAEIGAGREAMARLADLPDDQRAAIEQHIIGERDYEAIAVDLECSTNVVSQRVSRGLRSLRAQMEATR